MEGPKGGKGEVRRTKMLRKRDVETNSVNGIYFYFCLSVVVCALLQLRKIPSPFGGALFVSVCV